jgi:hypothetical protein
MRRARPSAARPVDRVQAQHDQCRRGGVGVLTPGDRVSDRDDQQLDHDQTERRDGQPDQAPRCAGQRGHHRRQHGQQRDDRHADDPVRLERAIFLRPVERAHPGQVELRQHGQEHQDRDGDEDLAHAYPFRQADPAGGRAARRPPGNGHRVRNCARRRPPGVRVLT